MIHLNRLPASAQSSFELERIVTQKVIRDPELRQKR
jgi:hypothetical protein